MIIYLLLIILFNILGLIAVGFAIASRYVSARDWDGAQMRGKIALFFSVTGIILSTIGVLIFVLIFFSKDSSA